MSPVRSKSYIQDEGQEEQDYQLEKRPKFDTKQLDEVSESSDEDIKESSTNPESKHTDKAGKEYLAKLYESLPPALDIKRIDTEGDDIAASHEKRFKAQMKALDGARDKKQ
jgi:uncharacterized protein YnzC (UPF0291/DUF896 family)